MEKCGKYQWEIWNQLNGRNPCEFRTPRSKLGVNLQKSDCYGLDSERKKVLTSSPGPLACAYIHLGVFGSVGTHLPSVKSILPYFSSPRGVAISVSFPEARIRKETVSGLVSALESCGFQRSARPLSFLWQHLLLCKMLYEWILCLQDSISWRTVYCICFLNNDYFLIFLSKFIMKLKFV